MHSHRCATFFMHFKPYLMPVFFMSGWLSLPWWRTLILAAVLNLVELSKSSFNLQAEVSFFAAFWHLVSRPLLQPTLTEIHHLGSSTISLLGHHCACEPGWPLCTIAHRPLLCRFKHIPGVSSLFYRRVGQISKKACSSRNPTGSVARWILVAV